MNRMIQLNNIMVLLSVFGSLSLCAMENSDKTSKSILILTRDDMRKKQSVGQELADVKKRKIDEQAEKHWNKKFKKFNYTSLDSKPLVKRTNRFNYKQWRAENKKIMLTPTMADLKKIAQQNEKEQQKIAKKNNKS